MGINLTPYAGLNIRLRITNRDCNWAGHFGYTYFTIGCQDAELTAIPDASGDSTILKAPDGFNYSWTNSCTSQVVSTSQTLSVANTDSCNYSCTCMFKVQSFCSFTLTANFTRYLFQFHTMCQGDVYNWRGRSLTTAGVYYDSVMNGQRCDSLIQLTLTVKPSYEITYLDYDGSLLLRDTLCTGVMPLYTGATPTRDATAQYSYTFKGWSPALDTVTAAATYTAQYDSVIRKYNVTVNFDPSMGNVTGAGAYNYGQTVSLTAIPDEHHNFVSWSNGSTSTTISFTVTEDSTLAATFVAKTYNVVAMANYSSRGTVSGSGEYSYLQTATLTASPNEGYKFTGWSNGETGQAIFVTVVSDTALTAYFVSDSAETALIDVSDGFDFTVYPNPVNNGGTVYVQTSEPVRILQIYNADGKLIDSIQPSGNKAELKGLNVTGIYLVRIIRLNGTIATKKVIVE